jgi:predicted SAM-dependent methyltransferase
MKLNLGCGNDVKKGYTNVDFRPTDPSVMQVDLSKFPWPFEDGSADEILMLDFLEHFPYATTQFILLEVFRILSDTGTVVIQVPDGIHTARALIGEGYYFCNKCENVAEIVDHACKNCGHTTLEISEAAMRRLYGGQDYHGNFHQTCFTPYSLIRKARDCGLSFVQFEEVEHQWKNWNFKATFKKADLW